MVVHVTLNEFFWWIALSITALTAIILISMILEYKESNKTRVKENSIDFDMAKINYYKNGYDF
ncbi:hypothetical protein [Paenibacillus sp. SI8]|uniref:hypothetical protein n=1 Tax=unclassified Paenibacillus TaxID=185978 RepID=UPI003464FE4F